MWPDGNIPTDNYVSYLLDLPVTKMAYLIYPSFRSIRTGSSRKRLAYSTSYNINYYFYIYVAYIRRTVEVWFSNQPEEFEWADVCIEQYIPS